MIFICWIQLLWYEFVNMYVYVYNLASHTFLRILCKTKIIAQISILSALQIVQDFSFLNEIIVFIDVLNLSHYLCLIMVPTHNFFKNPFWKPVHYAYYPLLISHMPILKNKCINMCCTIFFEPRNLNFVEIKKK